MCFKTLVKSFFVVLLILSVAAIYGCKKDDTPAGGGGGTPGTVNYGSGTISTNSTAGNLSFSGTGVWPPGAGPSVVAIYDTVDQGLQILGYQRVSGSTYNIIATQFRATGGVSMRTYAVGGDSAFLMIGYNVDTTRSFDSTVFFSNSGSITVTSVSGSNVVGTYNVSASRRSPSATESFTGSFNITYARGRGVMGNGDQNPSAHSQHWSGGYNVQLEYKDQNRTATSVSVTGPGITGSKALTFEPGRGSWNSWTLPSTPVSFGLAYPSGLPFTYTFTITEATGIRTATSTVSCFQEQFATNVSPSGTVSGSITFSWTGISHSNAQYEVQLSSSAGRIWESPDVSGTSVAYTGPALTPGATYYYDVVVTRSSTCNQESFARGSFTYQ